MKAIHLFLLAALIGVELFLGVVVAQVIFYPQDFIGEGVLNHFQSGLIMTQIFVKFGYVLLCVSIFNALFEVVSYLKKDLGFRIRFSKLILSLIILALSLLFVFYFNAYILKALDIGNEAINTDEFKQIHSASEVAVKIIALSQILLFFLSFKTAK